MIKYNIDDIQRPPPYDHEVRLGNTGSGIDENPGVASHSDDCVTTVGSFENYEVPQPITVSSSNIGAAISLCACTASQSHSVFLDLLEQGGSEAACMRAEEV